MYYFLQKTRQEGVYCKYRKGPDTFWITQSPEYKDYYELKKVNIPYISIVIKREPKQQARYFYHFEINAGSLDIFQELLHIIRKIDNLSPVTPTKVRNLLLKIGIKEVKYENEETEK